MKAIAIVGREVMQPRGLLGLGIDTLDVSKAEMAEALRTILAPASLPLLVHCTQGKDRTGMVALIVLMALGVPLEAISHDYMLSGEELLSEKEQRLGEIREIGLADEFADVAPDMVVRVAEHLQDMYGGVDGYLDRIGVTSEDRERLRKILLC